MKIVVESIDCFRAPTPGFWHLAVWPVALYFGLVFLSWLGIIAWGYSTQLAVVIALLLSGLPLFIALVAIKRSLMGQGSASQAAYFRYLSEFDALTLARARISPELDEESRKAITVFLNKSHPDWSFDAAAPVSRTPSGSNGGAGLGGEPRVREFDEVVDAPQEPWWPIVALYLGMLALIAAMVTLGGSWVYVTLLVALGFLMQALLVRDQRARRANEASYIDYLRGLDLHDLRYAAMSPEIEPRSRQLLQAFLNSNQPGWSLTVATPV